MAIVFPQGFDVASKEPIDKRFLLTKEQMQTLAKGDMPDKYFCVCKDDGKLYIWDSTFDKEGTTGRFRSYEQVIDLPEALQAAIDSSLASLTDKFAVVLPESLKKALAAQEKKGAIIVDNDHNIALNYNGELFKVNEENKLDLNFDLLLEKGAGDKSIQTRETSSEATGDYSIAAGRNAAAKGETAIALGQAARAFGDYAFAEGFNTLATGMSSHAEGSSSSAQADHSHAEGASTLAGGDSSHAEGFNTVTNNLGEHAEGKFNKSNAETLSSIGIGTGMLDRKNAVEVLQNGEAYIFGLGGYDGTNPDFAMSVQDVVDGIDADFSTKVDKDIQGTAGKARIFNEADGGGAKFEHNDGSEAFVGVNDGGRDGMMAQIYADILKNGKWSGSRINVYNDKIYYTNQAAVDGGVQKNDIDHEIAVIGDVKKVDQRIDDLADIAHTGNVNDLIQDAEDVIVIDCNL